MTRTVRVRVSGVVQHVGYRMWCARQASVLGLDGWVRNVGSGEVEAVFAGEAAAIEAMLAACHQGPPMAKVASVDVSDAAPGTLALRGGQAGFVVLANA